MMVQALGDLVADELRIAVGRADPVGVRLDWSGRSTDRHPARLLGPFFEAVIASAEASGGMIEMHFEKLQHFNSSTITTIIQLIREARSRRLRLVVAYDASIAWQRLSFDALRVFETPEGLLRFVDGDPGLLVAPRRSRDR